MAALAILVSGTPSRSFAQEQAHLDFLLSDRLNVPFVALVQVITSFM